MSSDAFTVHVAKIDGNQVDFHIMTGAAGGLEDVFSTRSFALYMLSQIPERVIDELQTASRRCTAPLSEQLEAAAEALGEADPSALAEALEELDGDEIYESSWHAEHVGKFVVSTQVIERHNVIGEPELRKAWKAVTTLSNAEQDRVLWGKAHSFVLRATVTDPAWLAHVQPGMVFGTTAYDVWTKDPENKYDGKAIPKLMGGLPVPGIVEQVAANAR